MTVKKAFDSIVEDGIAKGAGDFVDPEALEVAAIVMAKYLRGLIVEVVHGRWIDNTDERGFLCNAWRKCSVCGGLNYSKRPPYCPNCGAKMDGGNEDGN